MTDPARTQPASIRRAPRVWVMTDLPGPDVHAITDRHGSVYRRTDGRYWRREEPGSYEWPFPDLLAHCGPLTEVVRQP